MAFRIPAFSRGWIALVLLAAALLPWFAADPSRWPGMVAGSVLVSGGLVLLWRADAVTMPLVLGGAVVLRLFYLPLEPVLSDDIYRYLWDARLLVEGGINPYAHPPDAEVLRGWRDEWLYPAMNSTAYYSVYPPLSQAMFALAYAIGGDTWTSYYLLKGLFVAAELGGLWMLRRHVEARHLMLYAWHPLALIEIAGQGHTEALAVGGIGLALWAVWTQRTHVAAGGIALAGLAKLYPWVAFPWLLRWGGWRALATGGAVVGGLSVWFWYPGLLSNVGQSLRLYVQLFEFNAGPYFALKEVMAWLTGADWSKTIGPLFGAITLLGIGGIIAWDWRHRLSFSAFLLGTLGLYLALATTVHPWYWLVIGVVAVLHPVSRWAWVWVATLSIGTYLFYIDGPYWIWVVLGWGGGAGLLAVGWIQNGGLALPRARQKVSAFDAPIRALIQETAPQRPTVLDIGCGEGAMGRVIADTYDLDVTLTDLTPDTQSHHDLPYHRCTPTTLPFDDNAFNATLLTFVLHHADDPDIVLREALRVSRDRVFILESVAYHPLQRRVLGWVDAGVNALRSGGRMPAPHPRRYRPTAKWARWAETHDATVVYSDTISGTLHPWSVLAIVPADTPTQRVSASSDTSSG